MSTFWIEGDFEVKDMGLIVKKFREEFLSVSKSDFCKSIEINSTTLSQVERGRSKQAPAIILKMCDVYNLKPTLIIKNK